MLSKDDLIVGTRIKWRAANTRRPVFYGTIIRVDGDEVLIEWDGQPDSNSFIYTEADAIHRAE